MNEIRKYSISGISFAFEEEACKALKHYLDSLKDAYRDSDDGSEIIADIEARIAELILSVQDAQRVVQLPLIQNIICQLGSAEDISDSGEHPHDKASTSDSETDSRIPRRLYRLMDGAKLGGVCTGLGKFFDIDPLWIRLGMFLPLLLFILFNSMDMHMLANSMMNLWFIFIVCYIILWFCMPTARSARQRLEMEGRPITARSVAEATAMNSESDYRARSIIAEAVSLFGRIVIIFLKIIAGIFVIGMVTVAVGLFISLFSTSLLSSIMPLAEAPKALVIIGILTLLTPLLLLIYILFCLILSHRISIRASLILFLVWILEIIAVVILSFQAEAWTFFRNYPRKLQNLHIEMTLSPKDIDEDAELDRLKKQLGEEHLQMNLQIDDKSVKDTVTATPRTPSPKQQD